MSASERVARLLDDLGRASALLQTLAEGDGINRMRDEELIAFMIALASISRAVDAAILTLRVEIARRIKEEPGCLGRELGS